MTKEQQAEVGKQFKVGTIEWSIRVRNLLKKSGWSEKTLYDLWAAPDYELRKIRNLGEVSLGEIRYNLKWYLGSYSKADVKKK